MSEATIRAARTFVQNLGIDVGVAVFAVLVPALSGDDTNWTIVGWSVLKTAGLTAASYIHKFLNDRKAAVRLTVD